MKIGVITYNIQHYKTQQILKGLILKYKNITLIVNKFKKYNKKQFKPLFPHRPYQFEGYSPYQLSKKYKLKLINIEKINQYKFDFILVGGSGIIKKQYLKKKIINCHSGLIPETRGLDAIKWAIKDSKSVGNTLHFIDENTDLGKVISHKVTKIKKSDNYNRFVKRHYKEEIKMLINFKKYLNKPNIIKSKFKIRRKATLRMSQKDELIMINNFNNFKKKYFKI